MGKFMGSFLYPCVLEGYVTWRLRGEKGGLVFSKIDCMGAASDRL